EYLRGWEWRYVNHLRHESPPTFRGHKGTVHHVAFSPDGALAESAGGDGIVQVWTVKTGLALHTLSDHTNSVRAVVFIPGGRLASASLDGTIKIWDAASGALLDDIPAVNKVWRLAISLDGRHLASASGDFGAADPGRAALQVWDTTTGHEVCHAD